jgi:protein TonB
VAGELSSGQQVAIELRLPRVAVPVRARAIVRHQARLQCGLELVGLSPDQKDMIRYWIYQSNLRNAEQPTKKIEIKKDSIAPPGRAAVQDSTASRRRIPTAFKLRAYEEFWPRLQTIRMSRRAVYSLVALLLVVAALVWFRWEKAWYELERQDSSANAVVRVAPETMAMRVVTKVDPIYPEAARKLKTQGPVVMDAVIAPDGSVEKVRAISGPEILVPAAKAAVSSWKYEPYLLDGKRVRVGTSITVEFHPI